MTNSCEQQSQLSTQTTLNQPDTCFTTKPKQSHTESVKHLKWTDNCQAQGITFQVGMQVSIDSANVQGEFNIVTAIGDEFVLLKVDNIEKCVRKEEVLPYVEDDIPEVVSQREQVLNYLMNDHGINKFKALDMYDDLFNMGVIKEEE